MYAFSDPDCILPFLLRLALQHAEALGGYSETHKKPIILPDTQLEHMLCVLFSFHHTRYIGIMALCLPMLV